MATEAPPKRGRPAKTHSEPKSDTRTVTMGKTAEEVDFPRLQNYKNMGYEIKDDGYQYVMTGSQKEFEARQKGYQRQAIAQAERVSDPRDHEGDNSKERTISRTSRVQMTADQILGNENVAPDIDDEDFVNP